MRILMAAAFVLAYTPAQAALVNWTFTVDMTNGPSFNGQFTYDTETDTVSNASAQVTSGGGYATNYTVLDPVYQNTTWFYLYETGFDADNPVGAFQLGFGTNVADFGVNAIGTSTLNFAEIGTCNAECLFQDNAFYAYEDDIGTLTGTLAPVPLPAGGLLMLSGLGALALRARRS